MEALRGLRPLKPAQRGIHYGECYETLGNGEVIIQRAPTPFSKRKGRGGPVGESHLPPLFLQSTVDRIRSDEPPPRGQDTKTSEPLRKTVGDFIFGNASKNEKKKRSKGERCVPARSASCTAMDAPREKRPARSGNPLNIVSRNHFDTTSKSHYPWELKSALDYERDAKIREQPQFLDANFCKYYHEAIIRNINLKMSGHDYHPELDV